mgnify:FL=1
MAGNRHDLTTHHLLSIKEPSSILVRFREELAKPHNKDIVLYAATGATIEECLGLIAVKLDIALDGVYDFDKLIQVLLTSLQKRGENSLFPHLRHPDLVEAKITETEKEVILEQVNYGPQAGQLSREVLEHSRLMLKHGCRECLNRAACREAKKCLHITVADLEDTYFPPEPGKGLIQ